MSKRVYLWTTIFCVTLFLFPSDGGSGEKGVDSCLGKLSPSLREYLHAREYLANHDLKSISRQEMVMHRLSKWAKAAPDTVQPPVSQQTSILFPQAQVSRGVWEKETCEGGLIDEEVQKRWNNPPFNVLRVNIMLSGDVSALSVYEIQIRTTSQYNGKTIVNAELPEYELKELAQCPAVERISPVLVREINNDLGANATGASRLRLFAPNNWTRGYTGRNVIVGEIDTGIDWAHGDFIDPATNTTRIQYMWDSQVTTVGQTPAAIFGGNLSGLTYGTVYTKTQIDGGLLPVTARDTNGHGTHTSGTSAGNGRATGTFTGMAPNADIVFVKGLDNNGILFIYEMAARLGKPCVVNMSYGPSAPIHYMGWYTQDFPGDGTDLDSLMIAGWNSAYGGGHIPVKSSGNMGHWPTYTGATPYKIGGYHAGNTLAATRTYTLNIVDYDPIWISRWARVPWYTSSSDFRYPCLDFGVWYDSPVQITFTAPNGNVYGPMVHGMTGAIDNPAGWMYYELNHTAASNGSYTAYFYLEWSGTYNPYAFKMQPGTWTVQVAPVGGSGSGYCDIWVDDCYVRSPGVQGTISSSNIYTTFIDGASPSSHLSMYSMDEGASPFEILVGAWNTRDNWTDVDGNVWTYATRPILGHVATFSSPGPARNRFIKPDINAPGNIILSTLSQWCPTSTNPGYRPYIAQGGRHQAMSGTSMSCPHVTGGVALILQKFRDQGRPWPTVADIRNIIGSWAVNDAYTAFAGSPAFGYGKFNLIPLNEAPVASVSCNRAEIILDNGENATFTGRATDYEDFPMTYEWGALESPAGASAQFTTNGLQGQLVPDPNAEGTYRVSFRAYDGIYFSNWATASILARFYPILPPVEVTLQRLENNFVFYKEYVNRLGWSANSQNKSKMKCYRIYKKDKGAPDSAYKQLVELDPSVLKYEERGLKKGQLYAYKIVSVNIRGKESDPVVVQN